MILEGTLSMNENELTIRSWMQVIATHAVGKNDFCLEHTEMLRTLTACRVFPDILMGLL